MAEAIAPSLPTELFAHLGGVRWYAKTVQLNLEARGLVARVPGATPLRLRLTRSSERA